MKLRLPVITVVALAVLPTTGCYGGRHGHSNGGALFATGVFAGALIATESRTTVPIFSGSLVTVGTTWFVP